MSLYDAVKDLPLELESYDLDVSSLDVSSGFTRKTTTIRLTGGGEEGLGEDVTYEASEHDAQLERGAVLPLAGTWTIDSFSQHLAAQALFENPPERDVYVDYRRWGFESAALDLALRQNGQTLGQAVGRELRPLTYRRVDAARRAADAGARPGLARATTPRCASSSTRRATGRTSSSRSFASSAAWTPSTSRVTTRGRSSTRVPIRMLYRRVIDGLPGIWLEDPKIDDGTRPILEEVAAQVTWDAIIHSVEDIEALPWPPKTVNVKPSRFGSIQRLFAAYDYCEERRDRRVRRWPVRARRRPRATSSTSPRCSIRTRRTTSRPAASTCPIPTPGLPTSPLTVTPRETGFLAL